MQKRSVPETEQCPFHAGEEALGLLGNLAADKRLEPAIFASQLRSFKPAAEGSGKLLQLLSEVRPLFIKAF